MSKKIEHKIIDNIEYKRCSTCKEWKELVCFNKHSVKLDGLRNWCKCCQKQDSKQYYINNVEKIRQRSKQWLVDNPEKRKQICKQYRINNLEKIKQQSKQYRIDNSEKLKQQRANNADKNIQRTRKHNKKVALYKTYADQICWCEDVRQDGEFLEVKCAYCGKWLKPTNKQVKSRVVAIKNKNSGEHRFYCSDNCKQSCPIYWQKVWPKGFKKATSREVVPLLRQLVLARDNYTCLKCGATSEEAQLHVHHEKSYTLNKIMANDPDNCLTLCKSCHKEIHKKHGCRYVDLQCPKKEKQNV